MADRVEAINLGTAGSYPRPKAITEHASSEITTRQTDW